MKVYHQKITTIRKEQHKKLKKSCPFGTAPFCFKECSFYIEYLDNQVFILL